MPSSIPRASTSDPEQSSLEPVQHSTAIMRDVNRSHRQRVPFLLDFERGLVPVQPPLESLHGSRCG